MILEDTDIQKIADVVAKTVLKELRPELRLAQNKPHEKLMNIDDLSEYINRTKGWIYNNIRDIPHNQNGKRGNLFFKKKDVERWLKTKEFQV